MNPTTILAQATNQTLVPTQTLAPQTGVTPPTGVVFVYSSFIDSLVMTAVLLGIALAAIIIVWVVTKIRTPRESNKITESSHAKRNLLCLAHDDGTLNIETAYKVGHEGAVETKPVGKDKKHWTGFLPRQSKIESVRATPVLDKEGNIDEAATAEVQDNTERTAEYINKLNTRSLILPNARVKIWFAVKPKAILCSLEAIAAIQIAEEIKTKMGDKYPVDILALKTMVTSASWNESQINAQEEDKFHAGELNKSNETDSFKKMCLFLAIPIIAVALLIAVMALF